MFFSLLRFQLFIDLFVIAKGFHIPTALRAENSPNKKTLKQARRFFLLNYLFVIAKGFEPLTVCLEGRCSIQLSYATQYI